MHARSDSRRWILLSFFCCFGNKKREQMNGRIMSGAKNENSAKNNNLAKQTITPQHQKPENHLKFCLCSLYLCVFFAAYFVLNERACRERHSFRKLIEPIEIILCVRINVTHLYCLLFTIYDQINILLNTCSFVGTKWKENNKKLWCLFRLRVQSAKLNKKTTDENFSDNNNSTETTNSLGSIQELAAWHAVMWQKI